MCWAAYASVLGIAGLEHAGSAPWLEAALGAVMLLNLSMVWLRGRSTGRMAGFWLACAGAAVIAGSRVASGWDTAALGGVALTWMGSLVATRSSGERRRRYFDISRAIRFQTRPS